MLLQKEENSPNIHVTNGRKELGLDIDPSTLVKVYVPSTRSRFFLVRKHFRLASIE